VDVAVIAQHFGGGGHVRAAGCVLKGTYEECVKALAEEIGKQL
jgi:phosphoesterase RecJ-like protein